MITCYEAYLHGAFHDGTSNRFHKTFRFCQKEREWLEKIEPGDFSLDSYQHHAPLTAPMAV